METKTLAQAHPDLTAEQFLALPENAGKFQEYRDQVARDAWLTTAFRQSISNLETFRASCADIERRLEIYEAADFPSSILRNTRNSPVGSAMLEGVAGQFSGGFILKTFAPQIRKLVANELRAEEEKFERLKSENADALKRLELI